MTENSTDTTPETLTYEDAALEMGWENGSRNGLGPVAVIEAHVRDGIFEGVTTPAGPRVLRRSLEAWCERHGRRPGRQADPVARRSFRLREGRR